MSTVQNGDSVKVHYTGTLTNGEIFDSSAGREPLAFTVGAGQMIPGFDAGVVGLTVGDKKTINIPAAEAYGEWQQENTIPFPKTNVPADMQLEVGQMLTLNNDQGQQFNVVVTEIQDEVVILDANHPLAGKDLVFDVELVELTPAPGKIIL
ncbi:FKBP-type peptidyl-prolyl cis-trans isomerase [Polluticaenibacter yanchengensis]|uniref:Peptidyl-prolyl cis-trans isomerase n=1 Tax=Polluticaenibacter yanchengensis TaxID=3014562 RepID=A0ABT4UF30_9BACT|nr:peptidylprolyl isomerase [Chitinophagaceae bacterium LY-5]